MTTFVFAVVVLLQGVPCAGDAAALVPSAAQRAAVFDLADAAKRLQAAVRAQCPGAVMASAYTRGLIAAREAYRFGGSADALAPVQEAIAILKAESRATNDLATIASFVLQAATAAAQSERDDLALLIEHAVQLESVRMSAGLPGLPIMTAHEVAGELWLQVHRYDDARKAYERALSRIGPTARVTIGLARVAARVDAVTTACTQYRQLVASWATSTENPPEIAEARAFLSGPTCREPSNAR